MVLIYSTSLDGTSEIYTLAARYRDETLEFLEPLVPDLPGSMYVNRTGDVCRSSPVTGEPTLYFRDGGVVSMTGINGYCNALSNGYWVAFDPSNGRYSIARLGESQSQRLTARPGTLAGVDDNGVAVFERSLPGNFSEVFGLVPDGGSITLTASGGPVLASANVVSSQGFVGGTLNYYTYVDFVVWRVGRPSSEPIVRLRANSAGLIQAVSNQGDFCGRFYGGRRSFVVPIGYSDFINPDTAFPELRNLECAGVLADGVFLFHAYMGDPRRFVIATLRVGASN